MGKKIVSAISTILIAAVVGGCIGTGMFAVKMAGVVLGIDATPISVVTSLITHK